MKRSAVLLLQRNAQPFGRDRPEKVAIGRVSQRLQKEEEVLPFPLPQPLEVAEPSRSPAGKEESWRGPSPASASSNPSSRRCRRSLRGASGWVASKGPFQPKPPWEPVTPTLRRPRPAVASTNRLRSGPVLLTLRQGAEFFPSG